MNRKFGLSEWEEFAAEHDLPELPDEADESELAQAQIVIFRQGDDHILAPHLVTRTDALAYCDRDDTHAPGWFAGWWFRDMS